MNRTSTPALSTGMVRGPGTGRSDSVPALGPGGKRYALSDGEFVVPADAVSALGGGSSEAGARRLAGLVKQTRARHAKEMKSRPGPKLKGNRQGYFLGGLFEGTPGKETTESTTSTVHSGKAYDNLVDFTGGLEDRMVDYNPEMDRQVAGLNQDQRDAIGATRNLQGGALSGLNEAGGLYRGALGPLSAKDMGATRNVYDDDVTQYAINEAVDAFAENLPALSADAAFNGAMGNNRRGIVENAALSDLTKTVGGLAAEGRARSFDAARNQANMDRDRTMAGAGALAGLSTTAQDYRYSDAGALADAGGLQYGVTQAGNEATAQNARDEGNWGLSQALPVAGALASVPVNSTTTSTGTKTTQSEQGSPFGQLMGAGLQAAKMYGSIQTGGLLADGGLVEGPERYALGGAIQHDPLARVPALAALETIELPRGPALTEVPRPRRPAARPALSPVVPMDGPRRPALSEEGDLYSAAGAAGAAMANNTGGILSQLNAGLEAANRAMDTRAAGRADQAAQAEAARREQAIQDRNFALKAEEARREQAAFDREEEERALASSKAAERAESYGGVVQALVDAGDLTPEQGMAFGGLDPQEGFAELSKLLGPGEDGEAPSNVREWKYFSQLPEEDQQRYLAMRRNPTYLNLGDRYVQPDAMAPGGEQASFARGLAPENTPEVRGEQAAAVETAKASAERDKKGQQAKTAVELLDGVEDLIDQSTGSLIGTARDAVAGAVGIGTKGAQAAAELQVLQANLMLNMPRMEGPQSDRDVNLYREAAAKIGDPTVPGEIRKAAVGQILQIADRYERQGASGQTEQSGELSDIDAMVDEILGGE